MTPEEESAVKGLLAWSFGGGCSDCDPFRVAPSCIDFQHAHNCGYLESVNKVRALLNMPVLTGHRYEDPKAEMFRLAEERLARCREEGLLPPAVAFDPMTLNADSRPWILFREVERLRSVITNASDALFDVDLGDVEHQIHSHADTLSIVLRRVAGGARKALDALQVVIHEMVGG